MKHKRLNMSDAALGEFCRRHHILRMALFGSVIRDDFRPESDIDVLVEFDPNCNLGFFEFAGISNEFSDLLGRHVDLSTAAQLSPYFRDEVLKEAETIYDAA